MSHSQASAASLNILMEFLSNTAPDKVEAAADRLVAPDATYVSLNFSNPELKKIMPWTGTDKGPRAYSGTFLGVANYWKIEDFTVTDKFASGEDVAVFGKFTHRSVALGHVITSPFSIHAKFTTARSSTSSSWKTPTLPRVLSAKRVLGL